MFTMDIDSTTKKKRRMHCCMRLLRIPNLGLSQSELEVDVGTIGQANSEDVG